MGPEPTYEGLREAVGKLRESGIDGWTIGQKVADLALKHLTLWEMVGARPPRIAQMYEDYMVFSWEAVAPYSKLFVTVNEDEDNLLFFAPPS